MASGKYIKTKVADIQRLHSKWLWLVTAVYKPSFAVLEGTYDKEKFVATLKGKGIDTVLRYTEEGRIYGTTFIDHRTGCVLNGSRMGKELSANALQEHFTLPYAGQPPISLSVPVEEPENRQGYSDSKNVMLWYIIDV